MTEPSEMRPESERDRRQRELTEALIERGLSIHRLINTSGRLNEAEAQRRIREHDMLELQRQSTERGNKQTTWTIIGVVVAALLGLLALVL